MELTEDGRVHPSITARLIIPRKRDIKMDHYIRCFSKRLPFGCDFDEEGGSRVGRPAVIANPKNLVVVPLEPPPKIPDSVQEVIDVEMANLEGEERAYLSAVNDKYAPVVDEDNVTDLLEPHVSIHEKPGRVNLGADPQAKKAVFRKENERGCTTDLDDTTVDPAACTLQDPLARGGARKPWQQLKGATSRMSEDKDKLASGVTKETSRETLKNVLAEDVERERANVEAENSDLAWATDDISDRMEEGEVEREEVRAAIRAGEHRDKMRAK